MSTVKKLDTVLRQQVDLLQKGDERAFKTVFKHYYPLLYRQIYSRLQDEDQTDDLLQEVFVALWLSREKLGEVLSLDAYLMGIAKNQLHNYFRKNKRRLTEPDQRIDADFDVGDLAPGPEELLESKQFLSRMHTAVDAMPATMRSCFQLYHQENKSVAEIAALLGINEQTVRNHLSVAKTNIKNLLPALWTVALAYYGA